MEIRLWGRFFNQMGKKRVLSGKNSLTKWEFSYCLFCFVFYLLWMLAKPLGSAPDEAMRASIPFYIFQHNTLPVGNDPAVVNRLWGFSYAYYPQLLGAVFSAFCMKVVYFFTMKGAWLDAAARFPSVVCGTLTVYFTTKASKRLFARPYHWSMVVLVSTLPQMAFLSSYVNNDIIALCSVSILFCAWVCGIQDGWNIQNSVMLAVGISVCALSYYNAYGWILASIVLYFLSWLWETHPELPDYRRRFWKCTLLIVVIVAGCTSFFFIRNGILNHGDFLGFKTVTAASQKFAVDRLKPTNRHTPQHLGMSWVGMLLNRHKIEPVGWLNSTWCSFIGVFGWMAIRLPVAFYWYYGILFLLGLLCLLGYLPKVRFFFRRADHRIALLLYGCVLLAASTVLVLALCYSYYTDYSPQGRYIICTLPVLMFLVAKGLVWLIERLRKITLRRIAVAAVCTAQVALMVFVFSAVYLPSPANGLPPVRSAKTEMPHPGVLTKSRRQ